MSRGEVSEPSSCRTPHHVVMADRPSPETGEQAKAPRASGSFRTFEPSPEPDEGAGEPTTERSKGAWTLAALLGAAVLAGLTVFFASRLAGVPGTTEILIVSLIAFVVAFAGMVPMRWGLYVAPGVTFAGFGYIVFSMFFNATSRFQDFPEEAYGYAVVLLAGGVALAFVAQGVYSVIMRI